MIDTDKYEGHTEGPWYAEEEEQEDGKAWTVRGGDHWVVMESDGCLRIDWKKEDALLAADAPLLLTEVKRLHKIKSAIVQKLNEKGDEGEAISEANPNGHYKEDELRGWCEALEFVLNLMKAQEREE